MPEISTYRPGEFCWFELTTTDQNGAKAFYTKLFDWEASDSPMGPDAFYTMLKKNGKDVGALFTMDASFLSSGVPPHWNTYVAVANADQAASQAAQLGAKVLAEPFDVMEFGRMAVVQDPTGASFMLWEGRKHPGAEVIGEPNAFCWYELNTHDTSTAKEFYTKLLGWGAGGGAEYTEWQLGGKSIGGMMKIQPEWGPMPPNWVPYIMVENADASSERAKQLGGQVLMGPSDIPNTGRFAYVQDPQGAVFAIFEPVKQ